MLLFNTSPSERGSVSLFGALELVAFGVYPFFTFQNVCNVFYSFLIQIGFKLVSLGRANEVPKKFKDDFFVLSRREGTHSWFKQVKLLLKVVEADGGVYAVPI